MCLSASSAAAARSSIASLRVLATGIVRRFAMHAILDLFVLLSTRHCYIYTVLQIILATVIDISFNVWTCSFVIRLMLMTSFCPQQNSSRDPFCSC
jgi:hypothetical protein